MTEGSVRRQLTLFVPVREAVALEAVRRCVDPVQARLIAAHVTLCREEDLAALPEAGLAVLLARLAWPAIVLGFGPPEPFAGHGILMPCIEGEAAFQNLRAFLLGNTGTRRQQPHLTLAHPRNPRAPGNAPGATDALERGLALRFPTLTLVEQVDQGPWKRLGERALQSSR